MRQRSDVALGMAGTISEPLGNLPRFHEWRQQLGQLDAGVAPIDIDRVVVDTEKIGDFAMSVS